MSTLQLPRLHVPTAVPSSREQFSDWPCLALALLPSPFSQGQAGGGTWGFSICSEDVSLCAYYVSKSILGTGDTAVNKTDKVPHWKEKNSRPESKTVADRISSMNKTEEWVVGRGCYLAGCLGSLWGGSIWIQIWLMWTWLSGALPWDLEGNKEFPEEKGLLWTDRNPRNSDLEWHVQTCMNWYLKPLFCWV